MRKPDRRHLHGCPAVREPRDRQALCTGRRVDPRARDRSTTVVQQPARRRLVGQRLPEAADLLALELMQAAELDRHAGRILPGPEAAVDLLPVHLDGDLEGGGWSVVLECVEVEWRSGLGSGCKQKKEGGSGESAHLMCGFESRATAGGGVGAGAGAVPHAARRLRHGGGASCVVDVSAWSRNLLREKDLRPPVAGYSFRATFTVLLPTY